jgi:putative heme iron utilization protein
MATMNADERALLLQLLRDVRIAHLGTLREAAPMVSMTLFLPARDLSTFHVHVSRLAWHTQDMSRDPRVALSIAQNDDGRGDPFTLARVTLRGTATRLPNDGAAFDALKQDWLGRYPESAINFELADFSFWAIRPGSARFVAGFGRVHNLSAQALAEAAA